MHIVVIGAGIAGACCANALQEDGHRITLIDRGAPGEGCSYGNAGQINIGSSLPIAMPGMLREVPRWLLDPLGPLAVRWRYFPRALPWLIRWIRAGRPAPVQAASAALGALHAASLATYRDYLGNAGTADLLRSAGHLHVWQALTASPIDLLCAALREAKGIRATGLDAGAIRDLAPALAPIYRRGLLLADNGHTVNPQRLVQRLVDRAVGRGAVLLRHRVHGFDIGPSGIRAARTAAGDIAADAVVLAAGAWSADLAAALGHLLPLETERGYHAMLPDPGIDLRVPVSNGDHDFVATPMEHGLRLAGTVEIGGLHAAPNFARAEVLVAQAKRMLPGLQAEAAAHWMGFRPSFPDSLPVIDRAAVPNAYFAFGHGHTGLSGAPTTGQLVADLVGRRPPRIDLSPFRADRFTSRPRMPSAAGPPQEVLF